VPPWQDRRVEDGAQHSVDRLALDPERMRELGYRTVDLLVDALADDVPPLRRAGPELRRRFSDPAPEEGEEFETLLAELARDALPFRSKGDHPSFLAFIPFAGTWPGALGDFVASAYNSFAGSWMEGAGAAALELQVVDWFSSWVGYPATAAGALVSGGSIANLTALACAREALAGPMSDDLVGYVSDQAHSSIARAGRVLGFRPEQLRLIPADSGHRLPPAAVAAAIDADRRDGRRPLFVAASAGSTNTGAVDALGELAAVCRDRDVWLHVDAAYGGFAVLTERGRTALAGLELADSITLDPHKWLYQPYECGCVLVRDGALLERAFSITPHYLEDARVREGEVNFSDRGLQLTRAARALKVWLSVRTFGLAAFRDAIDRALDLAEHARRRAEESETLELLGGSLGVVCLRRTEPGATEEELELLNAGLVGAVEASGVGLVSSTRLDGRYAIRLCILSHTTTRADVDAVLDLLETAEPGAVASDGYARDRDVTTTRAAIAAAFAAAGREQAVAPGETIVTQGETTRDFYVVIDGALDVLVDGERVRALGPGDFFGELAALDWGAGYGYPRLATVVAVSPARVRVVPPELLNDVAATSPEVAGAIRAAVRERLPRRPRA
jgi:glutamate/tyrosine decarboxylase-like PLP-dependent enzyme